mmetsp:Transcript_90829/g.293248  ORF Transcript_90829/g.293248 Transcript_90829/m.293248 type:complete len:249 (-) Transcript_90829:811-1557(-)
MAWSVLREADHVFQATAHARAELPQHRGLQVAELAHDAPAREEQPRGPPAAARLPPAASPRLERGLRRDARTDVGDRLADLRHRLHHRANCPSADARHEAMDPPLLRAQHGLPDDVEDSGEALREGPTGVKHTVAKVVDLLLSALLHLSGDVLLVEGEQTQHRGGPTRGGAEATAQAIERDLADLQRHERQCQQRALPQQASQVPQHSQSVLVRERVHKVFQRTPMGRNLLGGELQPRPVEAQHAAER